MWDFFDGYQVPRGFLATTVVLLPKKDAPKEWTYFRSISLCNVTNKILSKVMQIRLSKTKMIIGKLASHSTRMWLKARTGFSFGNYHLHTWVLRFLGGEKTI